MNTLVFFFTLIVVIEVTVIALTLLVLRLRKSDNVVLALMGDVVVFVFVWLITSRQVDINDSTTFSVMAFWHVLGLVVITAGLAGIAQIQKWRNAHH